jgi:hypothetical protein
MQMLLIFVALVLLGGEDGIVSAAVSPPAPPRFSWDTVPVFYHSCNYSGPYSDAALQVVAKFPMVTIEKGQQVFDGAPFAEDAIVGTLKRVKALNPNISTIFYYNSVLDWPFYRLHEKFIRHPDWAVPSGKNDGKPCLMNGDSTFPNHTNMLVFDFSKEEVRNFWASECINMTKTGYVDGCFSDRAVGEPACHFNSQEHKQAYQKGHVLVHQELQKAIGNGPLVANHAYSMPNVSAVHIESFKADEQSIKQLNDSAALGKLVQAHAGYGEDGSDDHCNDVEQSLAAFLIGARDNCFYGCSRHWDVDSDPISGVWHAEYDKPLGEPLGFASKKGDVWTRSFKSGTVVTFDTATNNGHIAWAN